jgi:hypothetical protein
MKLPTFSTEPVLTRVAVVGALGWLGSTVLRTDPAAADWLGHNKGTVADVVLYLWPFIAGWLARRHVWPESKVTPTGDGTATVIAPAVVEPVAPVVDAPAVDPAAVFAAAEAIHPADLKV